MDLVTGMWYPSLRVDEPAPKSLKLSGNSSNDRPGAASQTSAAASPESSFWRGCSRLGLKPVSKPVSETGINRKKTETENKIKNETEKNWKPSKTETEKNWKPVLQSKTETEKNWKPVL
ncbi:Uncharacterized protein FWK35_00026117 [Aphis craccivora]|uniref:Uncharacterized protein n=1 Tax=Aphis craccivora TaxID=307492 RepID=A0A6G0WMK0_APHCR|nr:Uncharacterized protein FWK35_00026117 [Aphis craccivora]